MSCTSAASYPAEMIVLLSTPNWTGKREILQGRNTTLDPLKDHVIHQSALPHIPVRVTPRMKTATNLGYMIRFYCLFLDCMGPPGLSPQLTLLRRSTSGGFRVHCWNGLRHDSILVNSLIIEKSCHWQPVARALENLCNVIVAM
jgi:hypothetical protein